MPFDSDIWSGFRGELESRTAQLANELAGSWQDLSALAAAQRESFAAFGNPEPPAGRPQSLDAFLEKTAPVLLADPLAVYGQKNPLLRSLSAIEEHESVVGDIVRRLPKSAALSGRDLLELTGVDRRSRIGLWRSMQRKPKVVHLRDAVSDHLQRMTLARAALDGAFQLLLAAASLHLLVPWQTCRRVFLAALTESPRERMDVESARRSWTDAAGRFETHAAMLLERYGAWAASVQASLADTLLRNPHPASQGRSAKWANEHQRHFSFWSRQQRAIRSVIDLELHLARVARAMTRETMASLEALDTEHTELEHELDAAIGWLQQRPDGDACEPFPQPRARLLSSEERLSEWLRRVSSRTREELPIAIETVEPHRALPGWRKPWRNLEPAVVFLAALDAVGAPILRGGFQEVEAAHRAIIREIERAREVVDFGFETARLERGAGGVLAREAVSNALSLLAYQKGATPDTCRVVEASAARAGAAVLLESDIALEQGRIGRLAQLSRQRGGEAWRQFRGLLAQGVRAAVRRSWVVARLSHRWALLKIGWIVPPRQPAKPVVRRTDLAEALEVQLHARELPMIYRRLFRLAPVEDPRFLVGREAEMAGFGDAFQRWGEGKEASVIVVGARGSGKTSLINCAVSNMFPGCEVVRGQFCERLVTPAQMAGFVRGLFRVPADADLGTALGPGRRVVVVEEFERTFLRTVDGFDALRMLLDLMYSTARSTLWVFSINETAYRYLDGAAGLGRHFSHKINAMSVTQEDLTNAILQRHGLSGLRLEFAPLPEADPRVSAIRRLLGFEQDARKLFIDSLYEQSEGLFRAAFELWQGSIESIEGGIVHMRQPMAPDYEKLAAEMTLDDCFLLKAILQHGSLTAAEIAQVLLTSREDSLRRMERLQFLDLLEPEPASPGVRLRPEAGKLVRETLSRRNLL